MWTYESIYEVASFEDELYHHGVKGMKWGVRRYQNADGSLTNAGKKRQARIDKSDAKYRAKQMKKTAAYYDHGGRSGLYGLQKTDGINSLQKKLNDQSGKYDKAVIRGQLEAKKAMKEWELNKVSQLTHDEIHKEKVAVGKQFVKDYGTSVAVSMLTLPTTGFSYVQISDSQRVRSNLRRNS